ncbi:MAG: hypothetical protein ACFFAJ_16520 [Candidatus Hodarchaeota archaeon]
MNYNKIRNITNQTHLLFSQKKIYFFSFLFVIGLVLRIPPVKNYLGNDTSIHLLMAQTFLHNDALKWLLTPLSFIGYYPGAYVPILEPLILGVFILLSILLFGEMNFNFAIFLFSIMVLCLSIHSSYLLARYFFSEDFLVFLFVTIYIIIPDFLRLSVFTAHSRGLFIAFVPYFFLSYFMFLKDRNLKKGMLLTFSGLLILIVHKISLVCFILTVIAYHIHLIFIQMNIHQKKHNFVILTSIIMIISGSLLGFFFLPSLPVSVGTEWFSNKDLLGFAFNLGIFYFFKYGMVLFFAISGFILLFMPDRLFSEEFNFFLSPMTFLIASTPFLGKGIYLAIFLAPIITILSIYTIKKLFQRKTKDIQLIVLLTIVFTLFVIILYGYLFYLRPFDFIFTITGTLLVLTLLGISYIKYIDKNQIKTRQAKRIIFSALICTIFIFSSFSVVLFVQPQKEETFPYTYISDDEIIIANFLKDLEPKGMIVCYDYLVGRRIAGHAYLPDLGDDSLISFLIFDFIQSEDLMSATRSATFEEFLDQGLILEWENTNRFTKLWTDLLKSPYSSNLNKAIRSKYKIEYIITERNSTIARSRWGQFNSVFLKTMDAFKIFETKNLDLWKLA